MRFAAIIDNPEALKEITYALSFIRKLCLIKISPTSLSIITIVDTSGTQVWATLGISETFSDLTLKSLDDDVISMELNIDMLVRALKSCSSSGLDSVRVKLTKHNRIPYLAVMVEHYSRTGSTTKIAQEIPVKILRSEQVQTIHEPECPRPDAIVVLPHPLTSILKICDRYRYIGVRILVSANMNGDLRVAVENDNVRVDTKWKELEIAQQELDSDTQPVSLTPRESGAFASVRVDAKDLWNVLKIHTISKRIIVCICDNHALIVYAYVSGMEDESVLTYYLSSYSP
ncbi:checkpoint protein hus1 [Dipodascopsis uninucleata]